MSFIAELAGFLLTRSEEALKQTAVVLPGRRSCLFLRKELAKQSDKALFLPAIMSIEDYIYNSTNLKKASDVSLLTRLYSIYCDQAGTDAFAPDDFIQTGRTLLADFNDVDDYLLDREEVYTYLFKVREIEGWFPGESNTQLQLQYMKFYSIMLPVSIEFANSLLSNGLAYQGLASRMLAENDGTNLPWDEVVFAGLNAITPSMAAHINTLKEKNKATLFWDADDWYVNRPEQEAGHFMRMNQQQWPESFGKLPAHFATGRKKISFIGAPMGYSQIQTALELLTPDALKGNTGAVLVLADEALLLPLLNCLPSEWREKTNISMGYPLRNTLTGQWCLSLLSLWSSNDNNENGKVSYRFDQLAPLLSNPMMLLLCDEASLSQTKADIGEICSGRTRFFAVSQSNADANSAFGRLLHEFPAMLQPQKNWQQALENLSDLLHILFETSTSHELEHEAAWQAISDIHTLKNTLHSSSPELLTFSGVMFFTRRVLQTIKIPLKGEPMQGVQILGMLETRALDFRKVVIVGANEGFLPSGSHTDSFLPADIRRELGLPITFHRDSVYAFHFYRLLQRAEDITLIYNTESDPVFGKEPSRFLAQLSHELEPAYDNISIEEKVLRIRYPSLKAESVATPPREVLQDALNHIAENGLSFSRLFTFIECPLKFMLAHLLKIQETQEEDGNIAANVIGSVFHRAMEQLWQPHLHKPVSDEMIHAMEQNASEALNEALTFNNVSGTGRGYNFLVRELLYDVIISWLKGFASEAKTGAICRGTEVPLKHTLKINGTEVLLKGIADRIEEHSGLLRILDYKTGNKSINLYLNEKLSVQGIFSPKNQYMLQLLFYMWLYKQMNHTTQITGGIYKVLSNLPSNAILLRLKNNDIFYPDNDFWTEFEQELTRIVAEMYDEKQTFNATPDKKLCNYCPYQGVLCLVSQIPEEDEEE